MYEMVSVSFGPCRLRNLRNYYLLLHAVSHISRVGKGNLVWRRFVPHFLPNFWGIAFWVSTSHFASTPERQNEKYLISSDNRTHNRHTLKPHAYTTVIFGNHINIIQSYKHCSYELENPKVTRIDWGPKGSG